MSSPAELLGKIAKLRTAPNSKPLLAAATRAARKANADFTIARVPVRANVTATARGASIKLQQTGKLTKAFAVTPEEILSRHLSAELDTARNEITAQVKAVQ